MTNKKTELHLFFPTPIWTNKIENYLEINNKMSKYIHALRDKDLLTLRKSNIGGWHSPDFDLKDPNTIFFINSISPILNEMFTDMDWDIENQKINITSMWSIINNKEASNDRHIHGNNFISAAYYIKAPKNCGHIVFYDPRAAPVFSHPKSNRPNKLNANSHSIEPKEGLLVLFPSYLQHSVEASQSNEERIVISFNINLS